METAKPSLSLMRTYLPGVVVLAVLLAATIFLPSDTRLPIEILLVFAMAQGWNLLCGYTGLMSFGHQAFIGLGAYSLFMTMNTLGVPLYVGLAAAGVVSAAAALFIALVLHGQRDAYFSIGIWVLAESIRLLVAQWEWVGSSRGVVLNLSNLNVETFTDTVFVLALVLAVATQGGIFFLLKRRFGLGLMAVRDNDVAAASVGINAARSKLVAFVISAVICGLGGALFYLSLLYVDPVGAFDLEWQVRILFIVIIGGVGTLEGPILGTVIYFALRTLLQDKGEMFLIVQGALAVIVMVVAPTGIWGFIQMRTGWQLFPTRWHAN